MGEKKEHKVEIEKEEKETGEEEEIEEEEKEEEEKHIIDEPKKKEYWEIETDSLTFPKPSPQPVVLSPPKAQSLENKMEKRKVLFEKMILSRHNSWKEEGYAESTHSWEQEP